MDEEERSLGERLALTAGTVRPLVSPSGLEGDTAKVMGRPTRSRSNSVASERGSMKRLASSASHEGMDMDVVRMDDNETDGWSESSTTSRGPKKRKKGRPPTTGEYVRYAEAKRAAIEAEKEELELLCYKQRMEDGPGREAASIPLPDPEELALEYRAQPTAELAAMLKGQMLAVRKVATTSNRMKGTCVRELRVAAIRSEVAGEELVKRTLTAGPSGQLEEENRRLKARLAKMEGEMSELRKQMEELRQKTSTSAASWHSTAPPMPYERAAKKAARNRIISSSEEDDKPPPPPPSPPPSGEKRGGKPGGLDTQGLMHQIGCMVEEKLREFKRELVPPQLSQAPMKPSYAAATAGPIKKLTGKAAAEPVQPEWKIKKVPPPEEEVWTLVQRRKGTGKGRGIPPPPPAKNKSKTAKTAPAQKPTVNSKTAGKKPATQTQGGKPAATKNRKSAIPARAPRTAAITMTATPGGMSYADAMKKARASIDIRDLGIQELRPKRGVTGALILEVPGKEGRQKAAILAARMEAALKGSGVRIAQPVKRAELRVSGLDDSVTPEDVAMAVAVHGDCGVGEVQVGAIRRSPSGLGTAWVRCTQVAARKLAMAGKVVIGWSRCQVQYLAARPLQCYKCLEMGHVKSVCPNEADRSGVCYRCGATGHLAGGCDAPLLCALCAEAGKPASHRLGVASCPLTQVSKRGRRRPAKRAQVPPKGPPNGGSTGAHGPSRPTTKVGLRKKTAPVPMEVDAGAVAGPSTTATKAVVRKMETLSIRVVPVWKPVKGDEAMSGRGRLGSKEWP